MLSQLQPLQTRDEVILDTETTGLDPTIHEIVEFAAVKRNSAGEVIGRLHLKVRALYVTMPPPWAFHMPHKLPIPLPASPEHGHALMLAKWADDMQAAFRINGLDPYEVQLADRTHPEDAAKQILAFLENCTIIGQNVGFDMAFIKALLERNGVDGRRLPYHLVDTITLAYEHLRPLGLKSLALSKSNGICAFLGIPIENAHTAMGDVEMTIAVYDRLNRFKPLET